MPHPRMPTDRPRCAECIEEGDLLVGDRHRGQPGGAVGALQGPDACHMEPRSQQEEVALILIK